MRLAKASVWAFISVVVVLASAVWIVIPALALVEQTNICSTNESVCQFAHLVAGTEGAKIISTSEAGSPKFVGAFEEKCSASTISSTGSKVNLVEIEKVSFSTCTPCTSVTAAGLPIKAEGFPTSGGNGELLMPLKVVMSECSFGATCTFSTSKAKFEAKGSSTEPAVVASAVELPFLEGSKLLCGSSVKLSATYKVTSAIESYVEPGEGAVKFERELPLDGFVEAKSE